MSGKKENFIFVALTDKYLHQLIIKNNMMKSRIKTFNPIVIGNRLVPKRDDVSQTRNTLGSFSTSENRSIAQLRTNDDNKNNQEVNDSRPVSQYFNKTSGGYSSLHGVVKSSQNINTEPRIITYTSPKSGFSSIRTQNFNESRSESEPGAKDPVDFKVSEDESSNLSKIRGKQDKLAEIDLQLSFYETVRIENARILQKKYQQITQLKQTIEGLLQNKEENLKEIFDKNKRIEELSNQIRFKDIKIKQIQAKKQNQEKKNPTHIRKRLGSSINLQEGEEMLKKSNTDWSKKLSMIQNEKDNAIIALSHEIRELKNSHQMQLNEIRESCSNKVAEVEFQYQKIIADFQKTFAKETAALQGRYQQQILSEQNKHKQEKQTLQQFCENKLSELTKLYEKKIQFVKSSTDEQNQTMNRMNVHHQTQISILKEQFFKQKQYFAKNHHKDLEQERKKYNDVVRVLTNKNREIQMEMEKIKYQIHEKNDQIQNLENQIKKREKSQAEKQKLAQSDRSKYKRMENLWRDEKKKSDLLIDEKHNVRKVNEQLLEKIKVLEKNIQSLTQQNEKKEKLHIGEVENLNKSKQNLGRELSEKNKQISQFYSENKKLNQQINILKTFRAQNQALQKRFQEFKRNKQTEVENQFREKQKEKEIYKNWIFNKDKQLQESKKLLVDKDCELLEAQKKNSFMQNEHSSLKEELEELKKNIHAKEDNIKTLQKILMCKQQSLKKSQENVQKQQQQMTVVAQNLEGSEKNLRYKDTLIKEGNQKLKELQKKLTLMRGLEQELKQKQSTIQEYLQKEKIYQEKLRKSNCKIEEMEIKLTDAQSFILKIQNSIQMMEKKLRQKDYLIEQRQADIAHIQNQFYQQNHEMQTAINIKQIVIAQIEQKEQQMHAKIRLYEEKNKQNYLILVITEEQLQNKETILKYKEEQLSQQALALVKKQNQIIQQESQIKEKSNQIKTKDEEIRVKEEQIRILSSTLSEKMNSKQSQDVSNAKLQLLNAESKINFLMQKIKQIQIFATPFSEQLHHLLNETIEQQSQLFLIIQKLNAAHSSSQLLKLLDNKNSQNQSLKNQISKVKQEVKTLEMALTEQRNKVLPKVIILRENKKTQTQIDESESTRVEIGSQSQINLNDCSVDFGCGSCIQTKEEGIGESLIDNFCGIQIQCQVLETNTVSCGKQEEETYPLIQTQIQTQQKSVQNFGCGDRILFELKNSSCQWEQQHKQIGCGECGMLQNAEQGTQHEGIFSHQIGVNTAQLQKTQLFHQEIQAGCFKMNDGSSQVEMADLKDKYQDEDQSLESQSNKEEHKDQKSASVKDDESSAREKTQNKNVASEDSEQEEREDFSQAISDQIRMEKNQDSPNSEQNYDIGELMDELQEKQYMIEEMSQCIKDYKEMVWEMKQRLEHQETLEGNYMQILQIFNFNTEKVDEYSHQMLMDVINDYTSKVGDMMEQLQKMEVLNEENQSLNGSKKKFMKQLKKCQNLIEKVEQTNEELEKRLGEELFKNQKLEIDFRQVLILLEHSNFELLGVRSELLNHKLHNVLTQTSQNEEQNQSLVKLEEQIENQEQKCLVDVQKKIIEQKGGQQAVLDKNNGVKNVEKIQQQIIQDKNQTQFIQGQFQQINSGIYLEKQDFQSKADTLFQSQVEKIENLQDVTEFQNILISINQIQQCKQNPDEVAQKVETIDQDASFFKNIEKDEEKQKGVGKLEVQFLEGEMLSSSEYFQSEEDLEGQNKLQELQQQKKMIESTESQKQNEKQKQKQSVKKSSNKNRKHTSNRNRKRK